MYQDFSKNYTANVWRDSRVLYREIRAQEFQIYGDGMLRTISAKIICKVKKERRNLFSSFLTIFNQSNDFKLLH